MKDSTTDETQPLSRRAFLAKLAVLSPVACLALCAKEAQADTTLTIQIGNPSNIHGPRGTQRTVALCIKLNGQPTTDDNELRPCTVHCFTDCANHPDHPDGQMQLSQVYVYCERCGYAHGMKGFVYTISRDVSYDNVQMYVTLSTTRHGPATANGIHVPIGY